MSQLGLSINGVRHELEAPPPHRPLLHLLRELGLVGAKEGCAEGECGACAVAMAMPGREAGTTAVRAVNSCLIPAVACHGAELWTVEGLGSPTDPHPAQTAMVQHSGSQCGFCTPGFVVSMATALAAAGRVEGEDIAGNLCRCTGYRPILEAAAGLESEPADDPLVHRCGDPPPAAPPVAFTSRRGRFTRPASLDQALELLAADPTATAVAGATDLMVEANLAGRRFEHLVEVDHLDELRELELGPTAIRLGAALRLAEVEDALSNLGDPVPMLAALLPRFASRLVRHRATLGGNLATASPIGDVAPVLLALDARVEIAGRSGRRVVALEAFFRGYRETALTPGELLVAVEIPLPMPRVWRWEKFAKRREDDISTVSFAGALRLRADGQIDAIRLAFGGVAATPLRARGAESAVLGRSAIDAAARIADLLATELTPLSDHRGSAEYRLAMAIEAARTLLLKPEEV